MKLFVIALNEEIKPELLSHFELKTINNSNYYIHKQNKEYALVFSDVGKVNATLNLTKAISDLGNIEFIINIGSCGCANKSFNTLQTCIISQSQFLDVDLSAFGYELNQMRSNPKLFNLDLKLNNQLKKIITINNENCIVGTSDSFISQSNANNFLDLKNIDLIDMELAALCCVAHNFKIQIASIKVISDSLFATNKSVNDYVENQKVFSQLITNYVLSIIEKL